MPVTPVFDWVVNAKEPKWKSATAERSVASSLSFTSPIMNTCPIRCGSVMDARVRSAHETWDVGVGVSGGVRAPEAVGVAVAEATEEPADATEVVGDMGAFGVVVAEHPPIIRTSHSAAAWRAARGSAGVILVPRAPRSVHSWPRTRRSDASGTPMWRNLAQRAQYLLRRDTVPTRQTRRKS
jgi:hypothetical protein